MFDKQLPARPDLAQYKKQAKEFLQHCLLAQPDALARLRRHHPRNPNPPSLTDAQLVLAREHGFESWPRFAAHIETLRLIRSVDALTDPVAAFIEVACIPRHADHTSGTLEHAQLILERYPEVATATIHAAAILADEPTVRAFLSRDPNFATSKGGPHHWDALTHLCFSRFLRLDPTRSDAFLRTAETLLAAGASARTGFTEMIDLPNPRPLFESALYGASAIARHAALTQLLLAHGADPNDEEIPYHAPETYDNTITQLLLESGRLSPESLATILLRKADWHDQAGIQLALTHGADPNFITRWGTTALHQALTRDNSLAIIDLLLDHGADPALLSCHQLSGPQIAAYRGRGDVLRLFRSRKIAADLRGPDVLIAACAEGLQAPSSTPADLALLHPHAGSLLAQFAGNGNAEGLRCLIALGLNPSALYAGDGYFDIARDSTALHVAAWRAHPPCVSLLIKAGVPVNALDAQGRSALQLAVKAAVDSFWTDRRSPHSVAALLAANASTAGITLPTGYEEIDDLLRPHV